MQSWISIPHDPLEIILICWFGAQYIFFIIININNSCATQNYVETAVIIFSGILWWTESLKEQHLFEI